MLWSNKVWMFLKQEFSVNEVYICSEMEKEGRSGRAACANFSQLCSFFSTHFIKVFCIFCAILGIFANFARFWAIFAHVLCANLSDSKFCVCYFVSFFHLCICFTGKWFFSKIYWPGIDIFVYLLYYIWYRLLIGF